MKKWWLRRLFWTVAVLLVLMNVMAFFHARKFTHFDPGMDRRTNPAKASLGKKLGYLLTGVDLPRPQNDRLPDRPYETILLQSNKKIECWEITAAQAKGTVILFHGYGGSKASMLDRAYVMLDAGYDVLLPDFMGAGGSEGNECTIGFKEADDVKTCVQYLAKQKQQPVYLFGTSMGAAAVLRACSREALPVKALILECPFGSMRQTVKNRFGMMGVPAFPLADFLVFWGGAQHGFNAFAHNPEDYAAKISLPVLLLCGGKDDRVKDIEIRNIYNALAGPKTLIRYPEAGHESYLNRYWEQWTGDVTAFLDKQQ